MRKRETEKETTKQKGDTGVKVSTTERKRQRRKQIVRPERGQRKRQEETEGKIQGRDLGRESGKQRKRQRNRKETHGVKVSATEKI